MTDLTIACVLRSGGGTYDPRWVGRLQRNVVRFAPPHRFVCVSDTEVPGVETIALAHNWPRWWPILEVFRPGLFTGRVVYLDLADVIIADIAPLCSGQGFIIAPDPWRRGPGRFASGAMAFDAGDTELYDMFVPVARFAMARLHGDQEWIMERRPHAATFDPEFCVSYRGQCLNTGVPAAARIVLFHGQPKPHQVADAWVREAWERDW